MQFSFPVLVSSGHFAESCSLWSMDKMKAYFSVIKHLQPVMSKDANSILTSYFRLQRQLADRSTARTTVRMLESLSRLAEGILSNKHFIHLRGNSGVKTDEPMSEQTRKKQSCDVNLSCFDSTCQTDVQRTCYYRRCSQCSISDGVFNAGEITSNIIDMCLVSLYSCTIISSSSTPLCCWSSKLLVIFNAPSNSALVYFIGIAPKYRLSEKPAALSSRALHL